jgi:hypothetical protein
MRRLPSFRSPFVKRVQVIRFSSKSIVRMGRSSVAGLRVMRSRCRMELDVRFFEHRDCVTSSYERASADSSSRFARSFS